MLVGLFVCLFVCLLVGLFVCLFVCLVVCLFVCLLVGLFVCLFGCLFVCLFVCLQRRAQDVAFCRFKECSRLGDRPAQRSYQWRSNSKLKNTGA